MDPAVLREDMVDSLEHEAKGYVRSERVGIAMREVPRHAFLDDERSAYADRSFERLGTRVLAPSTAARLLEALAPAESDSVLVVGTGVGYTTAVAAEIAGSQHVQTIDISRRLVYEARNNLASAGYGDVLVDCRNGNDGLPEYAPYDRILVEAAAIEPPRSLLAQLVPERGRLVFPAGGNDQTLVAVERRTDGYEVVGRYGPVSFRPMLVEGEQTGSIERNRTRREDLEFAARARERRRGWEQDWIDWSDD
ncbi:MAG: protein-L-isoaspartate O-methyltransferase [Haloarculaceae archaeon]